MSSRKKKANDFNESRVILLIRFLVLVLSPPGLQTVQLDDLHNEVIYINRKQGQAFHFKFERNSTTQQ